MEKTKEKNKLKGYKGLKKLIPYYKAERKSFVLYIVIIIVGAVLGFFVPILTANALATLTEGKFLMSAYFLIGVISIGILRSVVNYSSYRVYMKIDSRVRYQLKADLISSVTNITMKKVDETNSGVIIERLNDDVHRSSDVLLDIMDVSVTLISNIAFLIYVAYLNIWFFVVLVTYLVLMWILDTRRETSWFKKFKIYREAREVSTGRYNEQVRGLRDVKSLNIRRNTIDDSSKKYGEAIDLRVAATMTYNNWGLLRSILAIVYEVGFILLGILFIKENWITLAAFLIVYIYHNNARNISQYLANIKRYSTEGELAAQRVFEIIDSYPKEIFGDAVLENVVGKIELKNLDFAYNETSPVLKGVNMVFEPNMTTALVGKSGSGKSTILSLLNRLYTVDDGKIFVDGVDINTLTEDSLRGNIGTVTQSPYIFNRSIRENMQLVKVDVTEEEIMEVLKKVQMYDFVTNLEGGIDSKIGENGIMLSGGQKQRLAIARLLLKDSRVIMLDEATSALDNENQNKIVDVINNLKKDHTIIIVAHRLSTIVDADKIVILDDGKIVDVGNHNQLIKRSKLYKELYEKEDEKSFDKDD